MAQADVDVLSAELEAHPVIAVHVPPGNHVQIGGVGVVGPQLLPVDPGFQAVLGHHGLAVNDLPVAHQVEFTHQAAVAELEAVGQVLGLVVGQQILRGADRRSVGARS